MGSDDAEADADVKPQRKQHVEAFYIDLTEVTNAEFKRVFSEHRYPEGEDDHPATGMTREQAEQYLSTLGKRLPSSAEWEKAARGTDGRRYPWGDKLETGRAHLGRPHDSSGCAFNQRKPVGSLPDGASPYGCLDMAGNAWEWVADDLPGDPPLQIIRGGAFGYAERFSRTYAFAIEQRGVT